MDFIYSLDLFGTVVFAISGVLAASNKKLDLFGGLFTGFITAVGGGTIRDLLIGASPVGWTQDLNYIYSIFGALIITLLLKKRMMSLRKTLFLFDTLGIGVFTIIGMEKALLLGLHPLIAIMMGVITAVMGGVLRDTFINDIPLILRKEVYASACIAGAGIYFVLLNLNVNHNLTMAITCIIIITIRLISVKYKISLPLVHDLTKT